MSLDNLAKTLSYLGDHARARDLQEQALAIFQRLYEGDHPRIVTTLHDLPRTSGR